MFAHGRRFTPLFQRGISIVLIPVLTTAIMIPVMKLDRIVVNQDTTVTTTERTWIATIL